MTAIVSMAPLPLTTVPDAFFTINTDLLGHTYYFVPSIYTQKCRTMCIDLPTLMSKFQGGRSPVLYEVLRVSTTRELRVYFDVDKAHDGQPDMVGCEKLLEEILDFLRGILGASTVFAVSQAHRVGKISFHIVCPNMVGTMTQMYRIAKLAGSHNLPVDMAVYKARQLMRPVLSIGEKTDSVPLIPHHGRYQGVWSDHIIQALPLQVNTQFLEDSQIPTLAGRPPAFLGYTTTVSEELIKAIDFSKLFHGERLLFLSVLKTTNNFGLFEFVLKSIDSSLDGFSNVAKRIRRAWSTQQPLETRDLASAESDIFLRLQRQDAAEALKIIGKHGLKYDEVQRLLRKTDDGACIGLQPYAGQATQDSPFTQPRCATVPDVPPPVTQSACHVLPKSTTSVVEPTPETLAAQAPVPSAMQASEAPDESLSSVVGNLRVQDRDIVCGLIDRQIERLQRIRRSLSL